MVRTLSVLGNRFIILHGSIHTVSNNLGTMVLAQMVEWVLS